MRTDRPPVVGIAGRESGRIRIEVVEQTTQEEIEPTVETKTRQDASVYTDEDVAYARLAETSPREPIKNITSAWLYLSGRKTSKKSA